MNSSAKGNPDSSEVSNFAESVFLRGGGRATDGLGVKAISKERIRLRTDDRKEGFLHRKELARKRGKNRSYKEKMRSSTKKGGKTPRPHRTTGEERYTWVVKDNSFLNRGQKGAVGKPVVPPQENKDQSGD